MTNFDLQLSKLICFSQLNLKPGDSLSINSEESTYPFSLELAKFAAKITNIPVNIVVTENGKVTQTVPVEPNLLDIQKPQVTTQIMCRILDLNNFNYLNSEDITKISNNIIKISEYGILSEPIDLKRRIAIPWTIVPYPSKEFVKHAFIDMSENEALAYFAKLLRFDNENMIQYWINQATLLSYRVNILNSLNNYIEFKNRTSKFKAFLIKDGNWASNFITLKNKRSFYNFLPSQNIHNNFDCKSFEGHIEASRDFYLFGKLIKNASFNFKNGEVISYKAETNKEALEAFFECDKNANKVSSIYLTDEETLESKYITKGTHPLYSFENTTSIILGGATQDSLANFDEDTNLDKININQSLVKLAIPIGDVFSKINIGDTTVIKDGNFVI
ncbi:MAG: aminopeptidase [Pleomorphochaeta sp.]